MNKNEAEERRRRQESQECSVPGYVEFANFSPPELDVLEQSRKKSFQNIKGTTTAKSYEDDMMKRILHSS